MTTSKSALVTGANKGIGREIARRLATIGFKVWLGARDAERGTAAAEALAAEGLDVHWLGIDVTNDESVAAAANAVGAEAPCLDVLVNNAGIAAKYLESLTPDGRYDLSPSQERVADIQATYDVNVFGPIRSPRRSCRCCSQRPPPAS
jgi:NAD(P)-dependent dehydrogenase (short-subunit alcohol dehydrogenase family)